MAAVLVNGTREITNTYRPRERAYLMHWCHKIFRNGVDPAIVPPLPGVEIEWVHSTLIQSVAAAEEMVGQFHIGNLGLTPAPSLTSLHEAREAIDVIISWTGDLVIQNCDGTSTTITTLPRTGMNAQLKIVGATYGVMKYAGSGIDKPHWSKNGH